MVGIHWISSKVGLGIFCMGKKVAVKKRESCSIIQPRLCENEVPKSTVKGERSWQLLCQVYRGTAALS